MQKKIPDAAPLTGAEMAIVIQDGKAVKTTITEIAKKAPATSIPVQSVNNKTGAVTIGKSDVGLSAVNNTADSEKPVSSAQQTAIDKGKLRVSRFTGSTNASGVATIAFTPVFETTPDIDVIDGWITDQQITGAVVSGSASKTGCQVQVMVSRGTLLLTSGPFQKAAAGVSITIRAIGN
jgi:hypothetical protein